MKKYLWIKDPKMVKKITTLLSGNSIKRPIITALLLSLGATHTFDAYAIHIDNFPSPSSAHTENADVENDDHLEEFNRGMFSIHEVLDGLFLKPIGEIYDMVTHTYVQDRVHNVLQNLSTPSTFINDCLQGEGERAAQSLARFTINSTLGLGGLYDFAADVTELPGHQEDFGQSMAVHGIESGPYLFIPILGPSTLRDLIGTVLDFTVDPINFAFRRTGHSAFTYTRTSVDGVDQRTRLLPVTDRLEKTHDPYTSYKNLYLQNREFNIKNGEIERDTPTPDED
jgi:phospholipid-binding lipoprotein MlaA